MNATPSTSSQSRSESWQLEGSGAEAYERYLVPMATSRWARHLIDLVAPQAGERVVDVGCGTGIVARTVAPIVGERGSVTGIDLNPDMLAVAGRVSNTFQPMIDWRAGDASALPFNDGSVDVVFCQYALQFFPDARAALREMHRVLAPGGRVALMLGRSVEYNRVYDRLAETMARHAGPQAGVMMRSPFPNWSAADLRDIVSGAGFGDEQVGIHIMILRYSSAADLLWQEASYSPLAGTFAALAPTTHEAMTADVTAALAGWTDDDGVTFPIESHTVVARR